MFLKIVWQMKAFTDITGKHGSNTYLLGMLGGGVLIEKWWHM